MRDLGELTADDFEQAAHAPFVVARPAEELALALQLMQVRRAALEVPGQRRQPFSLLFSGPSSPALSQGIHRLESPVMGSLEIFIVPVAASADSMQYEAVFS